MKTGYLAYIDESGCDGFAFGKGSTDFLVVSAIIFRRRNLSQLSGAVEKAKAAARKPKYFNFPTFKKLNSAPSQRWLLASEFSSFPCNAITVLIHKPSLQKEEWKEQKEDLYFHASKFLLERISWACRDTDLKLPEENKYCEIVFSKRGALRYENFQSYMEKLRANPKLFHSRAEWIHIDPRHIVSEDHSDRNLGHLIVDHFASAVGSAVEFKTFGSFDDRYVRLWSQRIYRPNKKALNNGIKIWPLDGYDFSHADPRGAWIRMIDDVRD